MRTWHPIGLVLGTSIAACFVKPDPPQRGVTDARSGDSVTDVILPPDDASVDALNLNCTRYEMDGVNTSLCGGWADVLSFGATVENGVLLLSVPQSSDQEVAACRTSDLTFSQVTIEIASVPFKGSKDDLSFHVVRNAFYYGARLYGTPTGTIEVQCQGVAQAIAPFVVPPRYVRLRWSGPLELTIETSTSPTVAFAPLGICLVDAVLAPTQIQLEYNRGSGGSAMTASFESVEICD